MSMVTLAELRYGAEKSQAKTMNAIARLTSRIEIAHLDEAVAEQPIFVPL